MRPIVTWSWSRLTVNWQRVRAANADVVGPSWLLDQLVD